MSVATLANRNVTIQRQTLTVDASGGTSKAWGNVLRAKARIQPLSATEILAHAELESRVSHARYVSGTPDIRPGDRLSGSYDRKTLYVIGVFDPDQAGIFLKVMLEGRDR